MLTIFTLWLGVTFHLCTAQFYELPASPQFPQVNNLFNQGQNQNQVQNNGGTNQNQESASQDTDRRFGVTRKGRLEEVFRWKQLGYDNLQPTDSKFMNLTHS